MIKNVVLQKLVDTIRLKLPEVKGFTMTKTYQTPPNLTFFNPQQTPSNSALSAKVDKITKQCRIHLTVVTDTNDKRKLDDIIKNSSTLLWAVQQDKNKELILQHLESLQQSALVLPTQLTTSERLSTRSHAIAQTCMFIVALSLAMSIGLACYAAYYSMLTLNVFLEGLVTEVSLIGVPAGGLGLFAYSLYSSDRQTQGSDEVSELQNDVNDFCDIVNDLHFPEEQKVHATDGNVVTLK